MEKKLAIQLSIEAAEQICKLGQGENCCAYLVMKQNGFECAKIDPALVCLIKNRLEQGLMTAKGEGCWKGCPWSKEAPLKLTLF
jgi:hypothetical protein